MFWFGRELVRFLRPQFVLPGVILRDMVVFACCVRIFLCPSESCASVWSDLVQELSRLYYREIASIEELNSTTCWIVVASDISDDEALDLAEKIGLDIRLFTQARRAESTPVVHCFGRARMLWRSIRIGRDIELSFALSDATSLHLGQVPVRLVATTLIQPLFLILSANFCPKSQKICNMRKSQSPKTPPNV